MWKLNSRSIIVMVAALWVGSVFGQIGWVFDPSTNKDLHEGTLLISGTEGKELNKILSEVPPHVLVGIQGITTDTRLDDNDSPSPFYWVSEKIENIGLKVKYDAIFGSKSALGTTDDGKFFIQSFDLVSNTTFAQAISIGAKTVKNTLVKCETRTQGGGENEGFPHTVCVFK